MWKSGWFPVTVVAFVLAGTSPALAQDIPDDATRARVADWMGECTELWRELVPMGASAPEYSGEQGRQKFLAFWQERGHPIVDTIRRSIRTCFSVGDRVEQSGRPCRALGRELLKTRVTLIELTRRAEHYLGSDGGLDEAQRRSLKNYLGTCVPAYAAVMDRRHPDDAVASPAQDSVQWDSASPDSPLHGSIAFSQEGDGAYAWGIAWSFDSSAGAQAEAIVQCREYGGTRCAEAGWFQEACGALAIGDENGYGTGWGATTAEAERDALRQCRAANDDCRIEVARCSQSEEAGGAGRMDGAMPEQEDSVATISTEPKCEPELFSDVWERSPCWHELENPDGCYVYWAHMPSREIGELARIFWSGSCSRGVATGEGTLEIYRKIYAASTEPAHYSATGTLDSNGLRQGRWVETDYHTFTSTADAEGHYVDGKRDGRWTLTHEGALRTAESYYVEGEQTSVWTDGVVELGEGWWGFFPDSLQHD